MDANLATVPYLVANYFLVVGWKPDIPHSFVGLLLPMGTPQLKRDRLENYTHPELPHNQLATFVHSFMHFVCLHTTQQPPPVTTLHLGCVPIGISWSELSVSFLVVCIAQSGIKLPVCFLVSIYKFYWSVELEALMSPPQYLILLPKYLCSC